MFVRVVVGRDGLAGGRDALALAKDLGASRSVVLTAPGDHSVGRGLRRFAEIERADLIVIGSCQHGRFERAAYRRHVLGTLHGADCAVAIAPAGYAARGGGVRLIGVGYDGSRESEHGLLVARELAGRHGAKVTVLAVSSLQSSPYGESSPIDWLSGEQRALDAELARLGGFSHAESEVTYGEAREVLEEFAEDVDLLIVGSRGYGPLRGLIAGSVSGYLVGRVPCPLLVVPRARQEVVADARRESLPSRA